ncbi:MAG TPA: HD domain-containing protein [Candidatus Thermoplasmatota archaeon]|nr:HD domain-containing protein [Candidatus Thermoplasmatota archaeon]
MADPRSETLLRFLRNADVLERLPRAGFVMSQVQNPETLAAHSYGVALTAMVLADEVGPHVNKERVLRLALVHDLAESLIMDLPAPTAHFIGKEAIKRGESRAATEILAPLGQAYVDLWHEAEEKKTLEARIVGAADKIQMMTKVLEYERAHRGDLRRFWLNDYNFPDYGIPEAKALFEAIRDAHEKEART